MAVSIAGVTAAQALTYYERRDEGYYHTEGNGEIIGKGAEALNISGQVETTVFGRLLLGQNSLGEQRSEERRVGKECKSRWAP